MRRRLFVESISTPEKTVGEATSNTHDQIETATASSGLLGLRQSPGLCLNACRSPMNSLIVVGRGHAGKVERMPRGRRELAETDGAKRGDCSLPEVPPRTSLRDRVHIFPAGRSGPPPLPLAMSPAWF